MNKTVKNIIIVVIVFVVFSLAGYFVYKEIGEKNINNLENYGSSEDVDYTGYTKCTVMDGIEFYYPSDYTSIGTNIQPTFLDPELQGASVNLVSEDSQNLSLEKYIELSKEAIKQTLSVQGDITESYINLNGVKAAKIEYVAQQASVNVNLTQVVIIKSGKAYILTIGCLPDDVQNMKEKADKMIKSFK